MTCLLHWTTNYHDYYYSFCVFLHKLGRRSSPYSLHPLIYVHGFIDSQRSILCDVCFNQNFILSPDLIYTLSVLVCSVDTNQRKHEHLNLFNIIQATYGKDTE